MKKNILRRIIGAVEEIIQMEEGQERQVDLQKCVILQEKAIVAGNLIEQSLGEDAGAIKLLEEYCELVYDLSQKTEDDRESADRRRAVLNGVLSQVSEITAQEKSKIVFMPYKSCMWDAMETIYKAALKDSDEWDVRVMPIPYLLKKEGRTVYEGESFQEKEGYTHYEDYDLEKERPDVIVIHNPYDDTNTVTQVEEQYFSSELIKITKHLVYVPYFIAQDNDMPWRFAIFPGVRNATDIYVQSEAVRRQYLKWHPNKNIKALGTPKVDRIVNESVYEEKEHKVFFLNTHLDKVLNEPKMLIKNMGDLLEYFKSNDQYELVWRPHPLSMTCFEEAEDAKRYAELVERAKEIENILYDESDDFWNTMKTADAYIGDRSSLVDLFGMTGKPMFIFEKNCGELFEAIQHISCLGCDYKDGKIWAVDYKMPIVFSFDLEKKCFKLECIIDDMQGQYRTVRKKGDILYLFPESGKSIIKVDLKKKEQTQIDIYEPKEKGFFGTQKIVECQDQYYIFPSYIGQPMIKFDGERIEECRGWKEKIQKAFNRQTGILTDSSYTNGKEVWMAVWETNKLLKTTVENGEIEIFELPFPDYKLKTLMFDGERFWLASGEKDAILCWSKENGVEGRYADVPREFGFAKDQSFCEIVRYENEVWFIPRNASDILILDIVRKKFEIFELGNLMQLSDIEKDKFYTAKYRDNYLVLFPMNAKEVLVIDMKKKQVVSQIEAVLSMDDLQALKNHIFERKNVYSSDFCQVCDFIEFVGEHYKISSKEKDRYLDGIENPGISGQKIWLEIRDMG